LNLGNILYDIESSDPSPLLIDFCSIEKCICYCDFVKLERDLKTRAFLRENLTGAFDLSETVRLIRKIDYGDTNYLARELRNTPVASPQRKLIECINALRDEVVNVSGSKLFNKSYFDALVFSTLTVLYRDDPDPGICSETQKVVACESAATLLSRILQRPLPKQIAPDEPSVRLEISGKPLDDVLKYSPLTHSDYFRFLRKGIANTAHGNIRYFAVAGWQVFSNEYITRALCKTDSSDKITLLVYLMSPSTQSFLEFIRLSHESPDVLIEKIEKTKTALEKMAHDPTYNHLRIKLHFYDAIPVFNLLETPDQYLFRPYKIGESQGTFSVFGVEKKIHFDGFSLFLANYIRDLTARSKVIDLY
ncbi:hypothetical protein K8T06_16925, partial [bacterium]|nr:hypothetical protein [bacterium]